MRSVMRSSRYQLLLSATILIACDALRHLSHISFEFQTRNIRNIKNIAMSAMTEQERVESVLYDLSIPPVLPHLSGRTLKVVEFFSGIGGWASAFELQKDLKFNVVAAYDVNSISNEVYKHVYGMMPSSSSIESLSIKKLEAHGADIWVMSPPCQPYTRQHPATENDPRSNALKHLVTSLAKLKIPPRYIALENVIGFEDSPMCGMFLETLESLNYEYMQFALSPVQFGVPNERPRFYLLAVQNGKFKTEMNGNGMKEDISNSTVTVKNGNREIYTSIPGQLPVEIANLQSYLLDHSLSEVEQLLVPEALLAKNASWCMDIVTSADRSTSCFTKSYSKYFKGTGSVLLIPDPFLTAENNKNVEVSEGKTVEKIGKVEMEIAVATGTTLSRNKNNPASFILSSQIQNIIENRTEKNDLIPNLTDNSVGSTSSENFKESPETRTFDMDWKKNLNGNKLRFFSPIELLQLFGFLNRPGDPDEKEVIGVNSLKRSFSALDHGINTAGNTNNITETNVANEGQNSIPDSFFPSNVTNRKCYELIGNSLSVTVVSHLLNYLLKSTFTTPAEVESEGNEVKVSN